MRMPPQWLGLTLVAVLSLPSGSLLAAPDECLRLRDNPAVAACANQYGSGGPAPRAHPTSVAQPRTDSMPAGVNSDLRSVAVAPGGKPPPTPTPEPEVTTIAVDREALTNTVIAGAAGASLLVLIAFGAWKWALTLMKPCPYCGAKLSRSAHACRSCFRAF